MSVRILLSFLSTKILRNAFRVTALETHFAVCNMNSVINGFLTHQLFNSSMFPLCCTVFTVVSLFILSVAAHYKWDIHLRLWEMRRSAVQATCKSLSKHTDVAQRNHFTVQSDFYQSRQTFLLYRNSVVEDCSLKNGIFMWNEIKVKCFLCPPMFKHPTAYIKHCLSKVVTNKLIMCQ